MSEASHELALYIINSNWEDLDWNRRILWARDDNSLYKSNVFRILASKGVRRYCKEFGADLEIFSATDILLVAVELCEYYENAVKEMENE